MPNKMERFTRQARRVLSLAQDEAERLQHNYIGTEHLLLGLMREEQGVAGRVLRELGLEQQRMEELVKNMTHAVPDSSRSQLDLTPETKRALELAVDEARRMGLHYVETEHLMLALLRQSEAIHIEVLKLLGVTPDDVLQQTKKTLEIVADERRRNIDRESQFRLMFLQQFLFALGESLDSASKNEIRVMIEQIFNKLADSSSDLSETERKSLLNALLIPFKQDDEENPPQA